MASDISSLVGNTGSKTTRPFIIDKATGKKHRARLVDDNVRGAFEQWLKGEAMKALMELAALIEPAQFRIAQQGLLAEIGAKRYGWDDFYCRNALDGVEGTMTLMAILLSGEEDEWEGAVPLVRHLYKTQAKEMNALMGQIMVESNPAPKEGAGEGEEGNEQPADSSPTSEESPPIKSTSTPS